MRRVQVIERVQPLVRRWIPRLTRAAGIVLSLGVVALIASIATTTARASLGPHVVDLHLSADHAITVDLGPLGRLVLDSPAPWPLGVWADVGEIPAGLSAVDSPLAGLDADVAAYAAFFSQPGATLERAAWALGTALTARTVLIWSLLLAAAALWLFLTRRRSTALPTPRRPAEGRLAVATASLAVVSLALVPAVGLTQRQADQGTPSAVLASIAPELSSVRLTGRLAGLVENYGGLAQEAIEDNETFYADLRDAVVTAFQQDTALAPSRPSAPPGVFPRPTLSQVPDVATVLLISDNHCNIGMGPVYAAMARESGAEVVLNLGDTTMGGSSVEAVCVDALADHLTEVPVVVADGNHDSTTTGEQEAARGWQVLDGGVIEVAGLRILGDRDPRLTSVTLGYRDYTTREELAQGLEGAACAGVAEPGTPWALSADREGWVDILAIHDPFVGARVMPSGCVVLELTGHLHRRVGPVQEGLGLLYVTPSSGGAAAGIIPIGPLQADATATVLRYDRANKRPVALREVRMTPDGAAALGEWETFPAMPTQPVVADLSARASD
ncbi:metallophosphoesterase [Serinibacter salmoneus]|uniref:Putative MPP superfamily phosphohydrolase n=1 Tax=Serinibacter salmoneus TaxID=556530 RepID=A0A2A9D017_9MICO|nr:metallophosphoesterase [Serinibacter salmoneus]PFG20048.1 putative MPP superfamily phosphohydrolase [Serinibacter salmoneus]